MNAELAIYEALAKEILRRIVAEEDPEDIHRWLAMQIAGIGGGSTDAALTWPASIDLVDKIIDHYTEQANTPESERKTLRWPWQSWNNLIDPLEEGMLGVITAPDGQGKTMYAELLAEHWAKSKQRVVFVHYELNRRLMMMRRTARHTGITVRDLKSGRLTDNRRADIARVGREMRAWDGYITYLHTPGWSMERTVAALDKLQSEQECDVVVLDYLEKAAASRRQLKMFGSNGWMREADNVEQLKNFSERSETPTIMVAQMSKSGKTQSFDKLDRSGMRGAGEKSDKANLVVLLKRDRIDEGYSNNVHVLVDKNTMGATGAFTQVMQPEYFRIGDIIDEPRPLNGKEEPLPWYQK